MAVLEMSLVRLATMPAGDDVARLLARLDALEQQIRGAGGSGGGAGPAPDRGSRPAQRSGGTRARSTSPAPADAPAEAAPQGAARSADVPPDSATDSQTAPPSSEPTHSLATT